MRVMDFLAPRTCAFCGQHCDERERSICSPCYRDLPWIDSPAAPLPGLFRSSISVLRYEFPVDAALKALKFQYKLYIAAAFAEILVRAADHVPDDVDGILPVPLHWRRKMQRGFNQADELAAPLAKALRLPLIRSVRRQRNTPPLADLTAKERHANLRGAFTVSEDVRGREILLLDDILTTGATTVAIAERLLDAGAKGVYRLTVARTDMN